METEKVLVTVSRRAPELEIRASRLAVQIGGFFHPRGDESLEDLRRNFGVRLIVLLRRDRIIIDAGEEEFFFHPSMARLRVDRLIGGGADRLIEVAGLSRGDRFLDCTLGLGSDAVVASYAVGPEGAVVALESDCLVAAIVRDGLQSYAEGDPLLVEAMRRIQVVHANHREYLRQAGDRSFDLVYFDPMFRVPAWKSRSMDPLRLLADDRPLEPEVIAHACRVARRRVVLKEKSGSREFERLGFQLVPGSRYSPVAYGIIETGGGNR